jgi:hypothetical protein
MLTAMMDVTGSDQEAGVIGLGQPDGTGDCDSEFLYSSLQRALHGTSFHDV